MQNFFRCLSAPCASTHARKLAERERYLVGIEAPAVLGQLATVLRKLQEDRLQHLVREHGGLAEVGMDLDRHRVPASLAEGERNGVDTASAPRLARVEAEQRTLEPQDVDLLHQAI